jgi:hypothetical protein
VVEVVARGLSFEMPSEIPSGWTTLRFRNVSPMTHFAVIERVPEGQGLVSQQEAVAPVFQEDQDLSALEAWMDWTQPTGLITPAPAEFLGGLNEMPAGATGYFTVTLQPGEYAWIAEVPGAQANGMLTTFPVE